MSKILVEQLFDCYSGDGARLGVHNSTFDNGAVVQFDAADISGVNVSVVLDRKRLVQLYVFLQQLVKATNQVS